jgi:malonyl CoA-acyl carrier protein transacylase
MKIYMFPGQGSQFKGMGGDLFDDFQELTAQADRILGYSIKELCLDDPRGELSSTRFTQPALYVVNALSYFRKVRQAGEAPDFVMGHSLGEFNALLAAGCFDFETGLRLVQKRGELMAQVSNGGMAAVLNTTKAQIEETLQAHGLRNLYLANYNTPSQIVLSGLVDELAQAQGLFKGGKTRYYPLATSGAFHSAFMRDAMRQFREHIQDVAFADPKVPVIANVTGRPYERGAILETLSSQIASTVQWCDGVQYLLALGASRGEAVEFEELGVGDVLTKLVYTIKAQTPPEVLERLKPPPAAAAVAAADAAPAASTRRGNAAEQVAAWNRLHRIGTTVKSLVAGYGPLETRTEATVLFGHRAAVYMKGYNGYFDLDELALA